MKNSARFTSETHAIVSVEVPAEEFAPAYEKAAKELAKQVNIPGFRPGKAPRRVLEARIGKGYIIEQAINDSLDGYYQQAAQELGVSPMSRPEVEISEVPEMKGKGDSSQLKFTIESDVRPEISLPNPADITIEVPSAAVTDADVDEALNDLRERFASLADVDRKAKEGDYLNIDMVATIEGEDVDDVAGVSYKLGDGTMLDGQDDALQGAKAGDVVEFTSVLKGGEHEGETADVKVTVHSVKESTLPEADDDFAQMASEFDTIAELREDLKKSTEQTKKQEQLMGAEQKLIDALMEKADFPLPQSVVDEEVASHMSNEDMEAGSKEAAEHESEVRPEVEKGLKMQLLLDEYAQAYGVKTDQNELLQFLFSQAQMYGMDPSQFIQAASQAGQIGAFTAELARNKGVLAAMRLANVVDGEGNKVDVAGVLGEAPEDEKTPEYDKKPSRTIEPKTDDEAKAEVKKPAAQKANKSEEPADEKPVKSEDSAAEDDAPKAPAKSAKKADWIAYRVATGELTEEAASGMTKDELIAYEA